MRYCFFEYVVDDMIPGDWEWYLETYNGDPKTGARNWLNGSALVAQAYEMPQELSQRVLNCIAFLPGYAEEYSGKIIRPPRGVRVGILTCLRRDLVNLLGDALLEAAVCGELRERERRPVSDWIPVVITRFISIPIRKPNDAVTTARLLDGKALYASGKYSLILREDIYDRVRGLNFDGCRISWAHTDREEK